MPREAIPGDVSEAEGVFNNDRLARMNQISADRETERDSEDADDAMAKLSAQAEALDNELNELGGGDSDDEDDLPPEETGEEDEDEIPADDPEEDIEEETDDTGDTDDEPQSPLFLQNGEWMTRIKVDGEVKVVPYAKIQAAAQKLDAGDKRLEEANRLMKEVEERERKLLESGQSKDQLPAQGAEGDGSTETGPNEEILSLTRQYHDALLRGEDEETTAKLLAKLTTAGGRQPQVDVNKLVEEAERRVRASLEAEKKEQAETERRKTLTSAFETFKTEFKDIAEDEALLKVADSFTVKVAAENPTFSPLDVMREAGKRTRHWMKEKAGDTPRVNRKRNMRTATGNGTKQTPAPVEPPKKRGDVLNDMRRSRGQVPLG